MADLPDYYTQVVELEAEAYSIRGGADAAKSGSPEARDVYLATDTKKLYICVVDGTWTGFDASIIIQGVLTLYENMLGGGKQIKNIAAPTAALDAATKKYVDDNIVAGIANVIVGSGTRSSSGDQAITGLGFTPQVVIFFARGTGGTHQIMSVGLDDGTNKGRIALLGSSVDVSHSAANSIYIYKDIGNNISGDIKSFDADGFTIEWTLAGTMTADFIYLAMK